MSESVNFAVGKPFPLPILAQADGGMFQVDKNGIMFLLQLSRADVVAVEAFRTGEIEIAVTEVDGILFFLYRIDGIFKDGWGDAPLSLSLVKDELYDRFVADATEKFKAKYGHAPEVYPVVISEGSHKVC